MNRTMEDVLAPFGLVSGSDGCVFDSQLIRAAREIRTLYPTLDYDHRIDAPEWDRAFPYLMIEEFRVGYACFKYAVAKVIQPRTICEIGIGAGTGARAFTTASPHSHYIGIDDGSKDRGDSCHLIDYTRRLFEERNQSHEIILADSLTLKSAPHVDLFHVDGNHSFTNAFNDTRLACESGSEWILIDDTRDMVVSAAAMMAAYGARGSVMYDWTHFEDTWTGSILLHRRIP